MSESSEKSAAPGAAAPEHHDDHPEIAARNSRYGLFLFAIYLALYGGFIGVSAFNPGIMSKPVLAGVNLAIVYGMGLIFAALFLAAIYMWLCRPAGKPPVTMVRSDEAVPDVVTDQEDTR